MIHFIGKAIFFKSLHYFLDRRFSSLSQFKNHPSWTMVSVIIFTDIRKQEKLSHLSFLSCLSVTISNLNHLDAQLGNQIKHFEINCEIWCYLRFVHLLFNVIIEMQDHLRMFSYPRIELFPSVCLWAFHKANGLIIILFHRTAAWEFQTWMQKVTHFLHNYAKIHSTSTEFSDAAVS